MQARSGGRRTVPQVFVGDVHVGGFDDLCSLDKSGELDKLLAGETAGQHSYLIRKEKWLKRKHRQTESESPSPRST